MDKPCLLVPNSSNFDREVISESRRFDCNANIVWQVGFGQRRIFFAYFYGTVKKPSIWFVGNQPAKPFDRRKGL